jgi:hypothetical protein
MKNQTKSPAQQLREERESLALQCFPTPAMRQLESTVDGHLAEVKLQPETVEMVKAGLFQLLFMAQELRVGETSVSPQEVRALADSTLVKLCSKIAFEAAQGAQNPPLSPEAAAMADRIRRHIANDSPRARKLAKKKGARRKKRGKQ